MSPILAASLFDNPWMVIAFVVGGAIINWISSRKARQAAEESEMSEAPPPIQGTPPPTADPEWENTVRRLLGEEIPNRPAQPPPPPIISQPPPRIPQRPAPFVPTPPRTVFRSNPPPTPTRTFTAPRIAIPVIRRSDTFRNAVNVAAHAPSYRARSGAPDTAPIRSLRNSAVARRAYRLSLVFAPPKGLEGLEQ